MSQRLRVLLPLGIGVAAILAALPFMRGGSKTAPEEKPPATQTAKPEVTLDGGPQSPAVPLQVPGEPPPAPPQRRIIPPAIDEQANSPKPPLVVDTSPPPALGGEFPSASVETLGAPSEFQPVVDHAAEQVAQRTIAPTAPAKSPLASEFPPVDGSQNNASAADAPAVSVPSTSDFSREPSAPAATAPPKQLPAAFPPSGAPQPRADASPKAPRVTTPTPAADRPVASPATPTVSQSSASARRHVIRDGDTLERIAGRYLGDEKYADTIFNANRDVLEQRDLLPIGVEIAIPAAGSTGG